MADLDKIKKRLAEIAARPKNVTLPEIEWVIDQLSDHRFRVTKRDATHGKLFSVGSKRFMINHHNPGSSQVKAYSVKDFLDAMIELGLYE
jgi:hypothetical protein